ncbi:hypothetical protein LCGC14_0465500 [marine sediment metagenome]|uniref:Uncharacterized protein n=1 Tax=marine sediment metagenome TaxID=412755 RepID=A0A0F9V0G3_9ZZZZ
MNTDLLLYKIFIIYGVIVLLLMSLFVGLSIIRNFDSQEYVTENIVECNDKDGDLIEGLVCYDKIFCSNFLKFMNEEGCEEFVGGEK